MGAVFALFSAWYFWIPKILGVNYKFLGGNLHFFIFFFGVNVTFFPQHFLGLQGMPRRISDYPDAFSGWNLVSSLGSLVGVAATWLFLYVLYAQLVVGNVILSLPWLAPEHHTDTLRAYIIRGFDSLEWALDSPPKPHAFTSLPLQSAFSLPYLWLFLKNKNLIKFLYTPIIIYLICKYGGLLWASVAGLLVLFIEGDEAIRALASTIGKGKIPMGPNIDKYSEADRGIGKFTSIVHSMMSSGSGGSQEEGEVVERTPTPPIDTQSDWLAAAQGGVNGFDWDFVNRRWIIDDPTGVTSRPYINETTGQPNSIQPYATHLARMLREERNAGKVDFSYSRLEQKDINFIQHYFLHTGRHPLNRFNNPFLRNELLNHR